MLKMVGIGTEALVTWPTVHSAWLHGQDVMAVVEHRQHGVTCQFHAVWLALLHHDIVCMLHTAFKPDAAFVTMHTAIGTFVEVCNVNLAAVGSVKASSLVHVHAVQQRVKPPYPSWYGSNRGCNKLEA